MENTDTIAKDLEQEESKENKETTQTTSEEGNQAIEVYDEPHEIIEESQDVELDQVENNLQKF